MGKGRKPTPSHLKVVRGTNRADRQNKFEPTPGAFSIEPPDHLSERGREAWHFAVDVLGRMGVLTEADAWAVELLCEARSDWISARDDIAANGATYQTEAGLVKANPAVAHRNDASRRLQSLLSEFGFSPASRAKVQASQDSQEDPAKEFFG